MKNKKLLYTLLTVAVLLVLNFYRDLTTIRRKLVWQPVTRGTLYRTISAPGVLEAANLAVMKSEVTETVLQCFVTEGQAVKKNDPLLQLSDLNTRIEYQQRKNDYESGVADYKRAVREAQIQLKLFKNRAVAMSQVEEADRSRDKMQANLTILDQSFRLAQEKLQSIHLQSPIDGTVLKLYVKPAEHVTPDKELAAVGDINNFLVRAKIDELEIKDVHTGQRARITADAFPGDVLEGKVASIAPQAERDAFAKIEVVIDIANPDHIPLKHNLSVRANIVVEEISDALGIPVKYIEKKIQDTAWVVIKRGVLIRKQKIKLGRPAGDEIEVVAGLKPGDQVGLAEPDNATP